MSENSAGDDARRTHRDTRLRREEPRCCFATFGVRSTGINDMLALSRLNLPSLLPVSTYNTCLVA